MSLAWPGTAVVDETRSDQRYYLAAVTVEDRRHDAIREAMLGLRLSGSKFHWTKESDERRREIADVIAGLGLLHMVVMRLVDPDETDERARRKCLRRLLWDSIGGASNVSCSRRVPPKTKKCIPVKSSATMIVSFR
jgi:hypothetical protein